MMMEKEELKNIYKVNSRAILLLLFGLGFVTIILLSAMLSASKQHRGPRTTNIPNGNEVQNAEDSNVGRLLAVVKEIDTENKRITLLDTDSRETVIFDYTGGSNITDRYGKAISINRIGIASMVDATYRRDKGLLTDMNISSKAWEYVGVSNFSINTADKIMKIATTKYRFNEDITILDGKDFIPIEKITQQDVLTVWGYEETIWSITVTKGHGTVVLEDYKPFIGDFITIGYESMQQITDDMEITVREGEFNLTVENGRYSATKTVKVKRNEITVVSLGDLGPDAPKHGRVKFEITPFGADLYIDRELTSYANPIELLYGQYNLKVSLGGYVSYEGVLNLDSAGKTIKIDLPEVKSFEQATVSETDSIDTPDIGYAGDGTDTDADYADDDTDYTSEDDTDTDTEDDSSDDIRDPGRLVYIQSPIGASVYIDGEFKGISPCSFEKMVGSHVLTLIEEGYETMSYAIEVENDGKDQYFSMPALMPKSW